MPDSLHINTDSTFSTNPAGQDSLCIDSISAFSPEIPISPDFLEQGMPGMEHPFTLQSQSWITLLLLCQFFIYAYVFIRYRKFWAESIKELFQVKERSSIFLDTTTKESKHSFYLSILTGINLALFLYLFITNGTIYYTDKSVTILIFIGVVQLFFLLKFTLLSFLGYVFGGHNPAFESFKSNLFVLTALLGIFLYTTVLLSVYSFHAYISYLFIFGFICYICYVLLKAYKLIKYFYVHLYSFIYLILYLCTLEILPATLLYVVLVRIEQIV